MVSAVGLTLAWSGVVGEFDLQRSVEHRCRACANCAADEWIVAITFCHRKCLMLHDVHPHVKFPARNARFLNGQWLKELPTSTQAMFQHQPLMWSKLNRNSWETVTRGLWEPLQAQLLLAVRFAAVIHGQLPQLECYQSQPVVSTINSPPWTINELWLSTIVKDKSTIVNIKQPHKSHLKKSTIIKPHCCHR